MQKDGMAGSLTPTKIETATPEEKEKQESKEEDLDNISFSLIRSFIDPSSPARKDLNNEKCFQCPKKFSFFTRRHQCSLCGFQFCGSCCSQLLTDLKSNTLRKVCEACHVGVRRNDILILY